MLKKIERLEENSAELEDNSKSFKRLIQRDMRNIKNDFQKEIPPIHSDIETLNNYLMMILELKSIQKEIKKAGKTIPNQIKEE